LAWKPRICGEHVYHHIYAWGNDRHPVFKLPVHFTKYLSLLNKYSTIHKIDIIAYALMEWHVHLFIYDDLNNISGFMLHLHGEYAKYFNRITRRIGHVFGERFNNRIVKLDPYGLWLSRYIHRQPLEAKLVNDPKDYAWTSYRTYLGLEKRNFVKPDIILKQFDEKPTETTLNCYEKFVVEEHDEKVDWTNGNRSIQLAEIKYHITQICQKHNLKEAIVYNPHCNSERYERNKIIRLLVKRHEHSQAKTAELFGLTRAAITIIIKNNNHRA
jgi:REP element-mobilizing transposase RayT